MNNIESNLKSGIKKGADCFIGNNASLIGNITLGSNVSIWYNAVLRGDIAPIIIGDNSNIQDGSIIHVGYNAPVIIGSNVTIGHNVNLHGCKIEDNVLIGIGAIILDGAVIEKNSIVAAGSIVPPNKIVESGSLFMGSPAKFIRKLKDEDINHISNNAKEYVELISMYNKCSII